MKLTLYTDSVERLTAEQAFDLAVECGAHGVELGTGGQSPAPHLDLQAMLREPQRRRTLLRQLADRGLTLDALNCSAWPLHPLHGPAHEQLIGDTLVLAGELGVQTVVTMSGCPGDGPAASTIDWVTYPWPQDATDLLERQWGELARLWERLAAIAEEAGIRRIALELHPLHLVYNVPTLLRLRNLIGEVIGANVDPSHLFWQGADPVDVVRELRSAVYHIHLKDVAVNHRERRRAGMIDTRPFERTEERSWFFCTVGRGHGVSFWQRFLAALHAEGFDGRLSIEHEDPLVAPEEGVREAAALIRPLIPQSSDDRFARSRAQHGRARRTLAAGVATNFRRGQLPVPISFVQGRGARLYDLDGNAYIDYALAFGPMLLGHSPANVIDAVGDQLGAAIGFGASHVLEAELAEAICRIVPCAELAVFSNTGSEAVHAALRIARSATGRIRVIKFAAQYDGWFDPMHVGTPGRVGAAPGTGGQDPQAAVNTIVCAWNDLDALRAVLDDTVAAVIMEPLNVNGGCLQPAPGYLEGVRALTCDAGALLIFDEVITGFRLALGGAQERFGVLPDLAVLGKALGGGFPISAVCGRAQVLEEVASGRVAHVGTFNANPICAAAALAVTSALERDADTIYPRLEQSASRLADLLEEEAGAVGLPLRVRHDVGVAHAFITDEELEPTSGPAAHNLEQYRRFAGALLAEGVHVIPRGLLYVSTEHGEAELEETRSAVGRAAHRFAAELSVA